MRALRSLSRPRWGWLIVLGGLCGLSCSGSDRAELNPVQGKVLHKNQPLRGALVTFHPKDGKDLTVTPPTGLTGEDGTFSLTTGQKAGAPAGEYVVTVICSEVPAGAKKGISTGGAETQDRLQGAYADRATSKIPVTVKKGVNQLEPFDLK
jgi:hypothetical protein